MVFLFKHITMNITQETNQMETPKFLSDFPVIKYKGAYNIN